jgi:ABC-type phosphate/phosphonate transport system substrate-binding protein
MTRRHSPLRWCAVVAFSAIVTCALPTAQSPASEPFTAAFTTSMVAGLSRTDAQAAVALWANEIASTRQLRVTVATEFYDSVDAVRRAVDAGRVHFLLLSLPQYHALQRPAWGQVLIGGRNGKLRDQYLLITRKGAFPTLAALKGRSLHTIDGLADDMSRAWLESVLAARGLPPAEEHFDTVTRTPKAGRGVLPVYFGQADACLVTRAAFATLSELNPQVGQALEAIETSEPLVSSIALLDRQYAPAIRARLFDALVHLQESTRGRQVLNLFGVDLMTEAPPGTLAPSLELVRQLGGGRRSP